MNFALTAFHKSSLLAGPAPFFYINHFRLVMISIESDIRYWCWCRISFFFFSISVVEFTVSADGRPLLRVLVTSHKAEAIFV